MAIYRAMKKARDERDFEALSRFTHKDCEFIRQNALKKADINYV